MATSNHFEFNRPAPNTSYFTPAQYPPAGTAFDPQPNGKPIPTLFKPLKIRGVEFQNRIWLSPLCQYSSDNGVVQEWQHAHLGGIFTRGPGLTIVEATAYGGSFENRIRLAVEVVDAVRAVIPPTMPLFFRVSASEWLEEVFPNEPSWRSEDTVRLAGVLAEHGVDLIDVSSSGNHPAQKIKTGPAYQAHFAEAVKRAHGDKILVSAVGAINDGQLAQSVLDKGQADVVFVGRMFQKNPGLVWKFADDLGVEIHVAGQIAWGFRGRPKAVANK
ncbi:hypothetical protein BN946_scf185042.g5 [Trametes cinnabarina]|uniref:NADH:flavin oxidoreductase/NADH oxidase N-terminal domain-containing protein n=1 Tax=Pycnoporus cinnabarinus TaxID=5643 RepID=A0A060S9N5_PYCCI|nr:hypothetical protein BN946_scf185042.g5 [Trametes cinnabarina]